MPAPKLWGDLKPIVSVKELMRDFIDPASDYVFDSVSDDHHQGQARRARTAD